MAWGSRQELEDIEADCQLSFRVSFDDYVAALPFLLPGLAVGGVGAFPIQSYQPVQPAPDQAERVFAIPGRPIRDPFAGGHRLPGIGVAYGRQGRMAPHIPTPVANLFR